jgi:Arc/MetJ-type ribon-helix-helix transcriptional regulator
MISVRLSEDEYSALQQLCASTGARSVSDLTRDAMRALLNGQVRESSSVGFVDEFRTRLSNLDQKVEELAGLVASSRAAQES